MSYNFTTMGKCLIDNYIEILWAYEGGIYSCYIPLFKSEYFCIRYEQIAERGKLAVIFELELN